jgi:hypothetical protein
MDKGQLAMDNATEAFLVHCPLSTINDPSIYPLFLSGLTRFLGAIPDGFLE